VLHLVIRRAKGQPIMVVVTVRPGELGQAPQASRMVGGAAALGFQTVELGPMSQEESSELLDSLGTPGEPRPSRTARRALLEAAAGYPMVLGLLVQDWQARGDDSLALSVSAMTAEIGEGHPSSAFGRVFERIRRDLDSNTQNVLNLAAILGRRLNDLDMYPLVDLGLGQTVTGLSRLVELRVLRESGHGLEFVNELNRASAYRLVPSPVRRHLHSQIADRLIAARRADPSLVQGFEIAWHCIRSGRTPEATPYLLDGAREALRSGAPHEAERALASGIRLLDGTETVDARLLWAEALQEQGDWPQSLTVLEHIKPNASADALHRSTLLMALARHNLGRLAAQDTASAIDDLCQVVTDSTHPPTKVRALRAAAGICLRVRDAAMARRLYALATEIPHNLPEEYEIEAGLTRAMLTYSAGNTALSTREILSVAAQLEQNRMLNSLARQVYAGIAIHLAARGDYKSSLKYNHLALGVAERLGNDLVRCSTLANLALCYGRLGQLAEQLRYADRAVAGEGHVFNGFGELEAHYWKAMAHTQLGESDAASAALATLDSKIPGDAPKWMLAVWGLYKADVFHLLGQRALATDTARQALQLCPHPALPPHFEGLAARWLVMIARTSDELTAAHQHVLELLSRISELDLLDQAEIVAANITVRARIGMGADSALEAALNARTSLLPSATTDHVRKLTQIANH
jgi:tetratricopeptide (TPR) repeat protein